MPMREKVTAPSDQMSVFLLVLFIAPAQVLVLAELSKNLPWTQETGEVDEARWVEIEELVEAGNDGRVQDNFTCLAVMRARPKGLI